jgi:hypothetical protein
MIFRTIALGLISLPIFVTTVFAYSKYVVCRGEVDARCPMVHDRYFGCKSAPNDIPVELCSIRSPDGRIVTQRTRMTREKESSEGECGYNIWEVECLDRVECKN